MQSRRIVIDRKHCVLAAVCLAWSLTLLLLHMRFWP